MAAACAKCPVICFLCFQECCYVLLVIMTRHFSFYLRGFFYTPVVMFSGCFFYCVLSPWWWWRGGVVEIRVRTESFWFFSPEWSTPFKNLDIKRTQEIFTSLVSTRTAKKACKLCVHVPSQHFLLTQTRAGILFCCFKPLVYESVTLVA